MGLVRRFLIQYEPDFLKSHDIECKTIENGEGPQKKRSYDAIIQYDFEDEMKYEHNQNIIKYVLIKKIQSIVKDKIINGQLKQYLTIVEIKGTNKKGEEVIKGYNATIKNKDKFKPELKKLVESIISEQMTRDVEAEIDKEIEGIKFEDEEEKAQKKKDLRKQKQFELQPKSFAKIDEYYNLI